ncbi:MAG: Asp-tRNA(Asn)/Glu-tRNA(Gln) amidotransferase subunit GatC [Minisyncoccia bacterium]
MDKEKIIKLANLSRIRLGDGDAEKLSNEFDKILAYVSEVKGAVKKSAKREKRSADEFLPRNVLRSDGPPHEKGIFTEALLGQAPSREKNYIKVKKIL